MGSLGSVKIKRDEFSLKIANQKNMKKNSSLFITLLCLMFFTANLHSQIRLLKTDSIKCVSTEYNYEPTIERIFTNDSTLKIKTYALANCIGVNNPRIVLRGPLLNMEFDQYKLDDRIDPVTHKKKGKIVADCECVYQIVWYVEGLKDIDKYIFLVNGQISRDYKKSQLDSLLSYYEIENNLYPFYLKNVIDKNGQKQGYHLKRNNNQIKMEVYTNGIVQNTNDK